MKSFHGRIPFLSREVEAKVHHRLTEEGTLNTSPLVLTTDVWFQLDTMQINIPHHVVYLIHILLITLMANE